MGVEIEELFALSRVPDDALDAARIADDEMGRDFPGWELFKTVASGDDIHWVTLEVWARLSARALATSIKPNGRPYIADHATKGMGWVDRAGLDALHRAIYGRFPLPARQRAEQFGVGHNTYRKIREPVAGGMLTGLENYRGLVHLHYRRLCGEA